MSGKTNPGRAACAVGITATELTKTSATRPSHLIDIYFSSPGMAVGSFFVFQNFARVPPELPSRVKPPPSQRARVRRSPPPVPEISGSSRAAAHDGDP